MFQVRKWQLVLSVSVITDPSDPEAVIVPSAAPLQDTFVALADTVTLIGSQSLLLL
jgi:hypothetical protein